MAVSPVPSSTGCVHTALPLSLCVSVPFAGNNIQSYENMALQSKKLPGNQGQVQYAWKHSHLLMKGLDRRLKHCCSSAAGDTNTNKTLTQRQCVPAVPDCSSPNAVLPVAAFQAADPVQGGALATHSYPWTQSTWELPHNHSHGALLLHLPQRSAMCGSGAPWGITRSLIQGAKALLTPLSPMPLLCPLTLLPAWGLAAWSPRGLFLSSFPPAPPQPEGTGRVHR